MNILIILCILSPLSVFVSLTKTKTKAVSKKCSRDDFSHFESTKLVSRDVLPDGRYSDAVIASATQIALSKFNLYASRITENSPVSISALPESFAFVKITMNIDIEIFKVPIFNQILHEYTKLCVSQLIKMDSSLDKKSVGSLAHRVKVLAYECLIFNFKIADKQALKFLEFIYLFADGGHIYEQAFYKLSSCLSSESVTLILDKFVKYFDPNRQALQIILPKLEHTGPSLVSAFTVFIKNIYEKLTSLLDPVEDNDIFCRHSSKMITTILSLNANYEEFNDILIGLMNYIDPIYLLSSPIFFKAAFLAIPSAVQNNCALLDYFMAVFITDQVIARVKTKEDEIRFGGLFSGLMDKTETFVNRLSIESKSQILNFKVEYYEYDAIISYSEMFKLIEIDFLNLSKEDLENLSEKLDKLIKNFDLLIKIDRQRFSKALPEAAKKFTGLIKLSYGDTNTESNFYRFKLFLLILEFLLKHETYWVYAKACIINVFVFFTDKVIDFYDKVEILILSPIKAQISLLFEKKNRFTPCEDEVKAVYNFFIKLLGKDEGIDEFCTFLFSYLGVTDSITQTCDLIESVCDGLEISFNSIIIPFLLGEVQKYIETASTESLFNYDNGKLADLIAHVLTSNILNRSESSVLDIFSIKHAVL
jgi:hypothetical protein